VADALPRIFEGHKETMRNRVCGVAAYFSTAIFFHLRAPEAGFLLYRTSGGKIKQAPVTGKHFRFQTYSVLLCQESCFIVPFPLIAVLFKYFYNSTRSEFWSTLKTLQVITGNLHSPSMKSEIFCTLRTVI
jgi:hypothetical protein